MDKKNIASKNSSLYEFPDLRELRKTASEQEFLARLEAELKNLIQIKKKVKMDFQIQIEEINK